jgi:predicted transcriptional regulator
MRSANKVNQKPYMLRMTQELHSLVMANHKSWGYSSINELIVFAINQLIESHLMKSENNLILGSSNSENAIELILDIKEEQNRIYDAINELSQNSIKDLKIIKSIAGFNSMTNVSYLDTRGGKEYLENCRKAIRELVDNVDELSILEQVDRVIKT